MSTIRPDASRSWTSGRWFRDYTSTQDIDSRHPAFLWNTLFIIAAQPLRLMLAGTGLWLRFATALAGLWK